MRKMGILNKLNYQAGLLNDGASTEEVVITPDEQAELITESAENITNPEVAETEVLLNEIVAEDEVISEELAEVQEEQEVVAEGLQSDFTAVTTRSMIKSIERINARYGEGSIVTAGMQSDRFGGHKDLYVAGLQAKENFLKSAAKNVMALINTFIEKIKELAKKVMIFLNNDKKTAEKLLAVIKNKTDKLKDGVDEKLSDDEKKKISDKFEGWLLLEGNLDEYPRVMKNALAINLELDVKAIEEGKEGSHLKSYRQDLDKRLAGSAALQKSFEEIKDKNAFVISVYGRIIKVLTELEGKYEVKTFLASLIFASQRPTKVPSLETIEEYAKTASEMANSLKSKADSAWKNLDEFKKALAFKSEEDSTFASLKNAAIVASQMTLADLSGYTGVQKSMIWYAGAFVNKYQGTDAKADDKATTEDKK